MYVHTTCINSFIKVELLLRKILVYTQASKRLTQVSSYVFRVYSNSYKCFMLTQACYLLNAETYSSQCLCYNLEFTQTLENFNAYSSILFQTKTYSSQ